MFNSVRRPGLAVVTLASLVSNNGQEAVDALNRDHSHDHEIFVPEVVDREPVTGSESSGTAEIKLVPLTNVSSGEATDASQDYHIEW